jgi:hypothetical protein
MFGVMNMWNKVDPRCGDILQKLSDSQHQFFLTGSRFFGTECPNSDWDFFAAKSPTLSVFLESLGFRKYDTKYSVHYAGNSCVELWYYSPLPYEEEDFSMHTSKPLIQIQIVYDVNKKLQIQKNLLERGLITKDKNQNKRIWQFAYDMNNF